MQYYNNILCVEASWLIDEGIISESNYKKLVSRRLINVVRRGCRNTPALVAFDSLPERFKSQVLVRVSNPHNAARIGQLESRIEDIVEISQFFENYKLSDGRYLKAELQREYYANAIILNGIHKLIIDKRAKRRALGHTSKRAWVEICEAVIELDRTKYPHSLPANPRRLEDKFKRYMNEGNISLIHKNFTNKNAAKVDNSVKESLISELLADPRHLDNEQIRALYNMVAEKMGWKKITASAVAVWRNKLDLVTTPGRRGITEFMNTKAMQVKRSKPTAPLYYWTMDGWDVELLYQESTIDKLGHSVTTYHNRLNVVIVLDPCVNYPVGYAIGTHETPDLIKIALRNAVKHVKELFGEMYRTHQLQTDHYAIKTMSPLYEAISEKYTPARIRNAKAKVIEPYFKRINKKYCQLMPNWSGYGVTANKENQPNTEFLNKFRHNFPTRVECETQIDRIIALERADKITRYRELWDKMPVENRLELSFEQYLYWFGAETGHKNTLSGTGLMLKIDGKARNYECFDTNFRNYGSEEWIVKYDPDADDKVLAVNKDGTLRFMLEKVYVQPMALKDRAPGDYEQLARIRKFNEKLVEDIIDYKTNTGEVVNELFASTPELNDTLTKLILVDSRGQHKDNRNSQRELAAKADKVTARIEKKAKKLALQKWNSEQEEYIDNKVQINKYL